MAPRAPRRQSAHLYPETPSMTTTPRELLSPAETARRLGMSRVTLYTKLKDGTLARFGVVEANRLTGRRWFFADTVDRALSKRLAVGR
jgi:AraC-like DNA-binding protein